MRGNRGHRAIGGPKVRAGHAIPQIQAGQVRFGRPRPGFIEIQEGGQTPATLKILVKQVMLVQILVAQAGQAGVETGRVCFQGRDKKIQIDRLGQD